MRKQAQGSVAVTRALESSNKWAMKPKTTSAKSRTILLMTTEFLAFLMNDSWNFMSSFQINIDIDIILAISNLNCQQIFSLEASKDYLSIIAMHQEGNQDWWID
jgi:hypothetical protein